MSPPRVLVLSFSHLTRDPRVLRQIRLLQGAYDVVTAGYGPAPAGVTNHVELPDGPWRPRLTDRALLLALRGHARLYFGSNRIRTLLAQASRLGPMDVVVANDALAVPAALALRPRLGVHADLHEYAPRQGDTRSWHLLFAPLMRWACDHLSHVASATTVSGGIAAEYERNFGIRPTVVPNATPFRPDLTPTPTPEPIRLVHAGVAGRARKLELMVDAVRAVNAQAPGRYSLDLFLVPGDQSYIEELTARAGDSTVTGVRLREPVRFEELVPTMHRYDVGVFVCPPTTFNLRHTLPNKFFEFIQARLAVLIGPSPEMSRYVAEHALGVVTADFSVEATQQALEAWDAQQVDRHKAASHAAAEELSAERLSGPWLEAVDRLTGQ